ncbi:MAG: hypothetical protein CMN77_03280 [Spirochaetaceae bacterium]|nr:hypothetical protein [Spirochaetaceae bacterium]
MKLALKKKTLTYITILVSLLVTAGIWIGISITRDLPSATPGPAAERKTALVEDFTGLKAWKETDAISFRFNPAHRKHLFDRNRRLVRVQFLNNESSDDKSASPNPDGNEGKASESGTLQSNGEVTVLLQLDSKKGLVFENGKELSGSDKGAWLQKAYEAHINDLFWLNPFSALRAPGAVRRLTDDQGLLITYETGGVTPGDSYLIYADARGKPQRWLLWTQAIPARGIEFTFEDWKEFENGLRISQKRASFLRNVELDEIEIYPDFPGQRPDPFAPLLERIAKEEAR